MMGDVPVEPVRSQPVGESGDDGSYGMTPLLDQPFDGESLYALRSAVEAHAIAAGMPQGRAEDMVIAVHELATNAVRHGAGSGRLTMWQLPGSLRCEVHDRGRGGGNIMPDATGNNADAWPYEQGHGLWLIRHTADGMDLRSGPGGTVAALTFTLPPPGARPPFTITPQTRDGCVVLTVGGDLDRAAGPKLLTAAVEAAAGARPVIVNLDEIAFWDSAGIATLVTLQHRLEPLSTSTLVIAGAPTTLRRRLNDTGLTGGLTLASGLDEAVELAVRTL